jgi:hypothetical protein
VLVAAVPPSTLMVPNAPGHTNCEKPPELQTPLQVASLVLVEPYSVPEVSYEVDTGLVPWPPFPQK